MKKEKVVEEKKNRGFIKDGAEKDPTAQHQFMLRFEPELFERVQQQALRRFGISLSVYIRLAILEKLEEDETSEAVMRKKYVRTT